MKYNEEIRRLFKTYLEGNASCRQEEELLHYLESGNTDDKQLSDLIEEAWVAEPSLREDSSEIDQEFEAIFAKVAHKQQKKNQRFQIWKYAASVLLVTSVALGWYSYQQNQVKHVETIEMLSRTTRRGEKVKIILTDSTVVYLSGSSTLRWPARFVKGHNRNIHLEGEGFFEVKQDALSPFMVYSGNIQTSVLGTSFNVCAYPADQLFSVTVKTGKVRVSESHQGVLKGLSLLTAGMKLDYNNMDQKYVVNTVRAENVSSWTANRFIFIDTDLKTMLDKLEHYYNVRFDLKSECLPKGRQFNATFEQKNIKQIMEQVQMMSGGNIHYKIINGTLIKVWGEGCK